MTIKASPDEQAVKEFQAKLASDLQQKAADALKDKVAEEAKGGLLENLFK